jgi:hypothetical protein
MGTAVQTAAALIAVAFVGVGILGFVPGLVTNFDAMAFAGHESEALLFGIFEVSVLHNIVHLLFGIVGFVCALAWSSARAFLVGGGVVYLVLWVYGLIVHEEGAANFLPVNEADNWLHLVLGVGLVLLGLLLDRDRAALRAGTRTMGR